MKGVAALALCLALTTGAQSQTTGAATAGFLWYDGPNTVDAGDARMRLVFDGRGGAAALTPNQYWHYARAYDRHLSRAVLHGAHPGPAASRARVLAFREVRQSYPNLRVEAFDLERTYGETVITPDW